MRGIRSPRSATYPLVRMPLAALPACPVASETPPSRPVAAGHPPERLYAILDHLHAGIVVQDRDCRVEFVNQAFCDLFGLVQPPARLRGMTPREVGAILCSACIDPEAAQERLVRIAQADQPVYDEEVSMRNGVVVLRDFIPIRVDGEPMGHLWVHRGVSQRHIEYLATHDELTGLPNRFLFNDRVQQAVVRAAERGEQVAVVFVDLDEFKLINDTLGHPVGDALLQVIAHRLRDSVRGCDTVARLGGDEFAMLIESTSPPEVETLARRVVEVLGAPVAVAGRVLYVGASLGIGMFPGDGCDGASLLQVADVAMYAAKAKGKRTYHFYTRELRTAMDRQLQLEMGLRWAIERDELRLLYQPQVDLITREVIGIEPLVRWQRPGSGWLMPASFIPMAERNGLIDGIGLWVAREACRQVVAWQQAGYRVPRMSLNVSAAQFRHPGLAGLLAMMLAEHGLDPRQFVIELTESALLSDPDTAFQQLGQLKQAGLGVSIDDFGTGHSSLSCLRRYPLDELKIDRSFIADIEHSERDVAVL
ncbi:MAG: hypothetical protein RL456_1019, partial [Pseudomonadota bacterium]